MTYYIMGIKNTPARWVATTLLAVVFIPLIGQLIIETTFKEFRRAYRNMNIRNVIRRETLEIIQFIKSLYRGKL